MSTYRVKLNMSEEFTIEANDSAEAEKIARDKFGCDYYIDNVTTTELKKEMRAVSNEEFFQSWKDMINEFESDIQSERHEQIMEQSINLELPLLGIKTSVPFCSPTMEGINTIYDYMLEDEYFELMSTEECCYYTGGGIWIVEIPFELYGMPLVFVVDSEDPSQWSIYRNVLKNNGKYDSVLYSELLYKFGNCTEIDKCFKGYYIKALQLLAKIGE